MVTTSTDHLPYAAERVGTATGLITGTSISSTIFEEMSKLATRYQAVNLGQGFPDTDGPEEMLNAAREAITNGINQYATIAGLPVLREAIAKHQERFYGQSVDSDTQVTVTAGASEALSSTLASLINPGDEVIIFEPYYDLYPAAIAQAGGVTKTVRLLTPDFQPDLTDLEQAFSEKTVAVVVNDPHNPTGTVFSKATKKKIVELAQRFDTTIIQDAVYEHLVFDDQAFQPIFLLPGAAERTVYISAISKTHSLTGWRVGWCIASAELMQQIRLVKGYYSHSAAAPLQTAAAVGVSLPDSFYQEFVKQYTQQRKILCEGLVGTPFDCLEPAGTFFATADISELLNSKNIVDAGELCQILAREAGVVLIPMSAFATDSYKPIMSSWVRFAFCKKPEVLTEAVQRLKKWTNQAV